jgi:hypothetical protein
MKKRKINYKAFMPVGLTFVGAGVVFMTAVNVVIGISLIGIGIIYVVIGVRKQNQ